MKFHRIIFFVVSLIVGVCRAQDEEASSTPVVKCMRPSDARYLRPSLSLPDAWMNNKWHTGPYISIGNDESIDRKSIKFSTNEAERMWLLEDTLNSRGNYFLMNYNMTRLICGHDGNGVRLAWFVNNLDHRNLDWCRWSIDVDQNNPANFQIKNTMFVNMFPEIGYVYFDETGIYFDYDERLRNYPESDFDQNQTWWTFVKMDSEQRDFDQIEDECEIGESGLATFLESQEVSLVGARGATAGRRKKGKILKSKDKFSTCAENWFLFKGKCYRVFKDFRVTNIQANKVCSFFAANLFIPRNKKERGFLLKVVRIYDNKPGYYWLGIKADDSGTFRDANNNAVAFKRWARSGNGFRRDSCAIWKRRWYRSNCAATHKVICEKEAQQRLTGSCGKIKNSESDAVMEHAAIKKDAKTKDRIVGGQPAFVGQFPWQAGIRFKTPVISEGISIVHNCGGSLIDECWVVTAAHCFTDSNKDDFYVRLGDLNNELEDETEQDFDIEELIIHENYRAYPAPNKDIALIKLRQKNGKCAKFDSYIQPICLPDEDFVATPGEPCQVSGWGQTNTTQGQSSSAPNLQWATLPLLTPKYCKSRYNSKRREFFDESVMICAGLKEGGIDSCTGDSGGPYVCRNNAGRYDLTGIVSFGIGCARRKYPGVYTNVREFVPWIVTKILENGGGNVVSVD